MSIHLEGVRFLPEVFEKVKPLIRKAAAGEWDDLVRRLPGLE